MPPPRRIDLTIAQGFGFVVPARARRNTLCILSTRAGATEPNNKRAAGQYTSGAALASDRIEDGAAVRGTGNGEASWNGEFPGNHLLKRSDRCRY